MRLRELKYTKVMWIPSSSFKQSHFQLQSTFRATGVSAETKHWQAERRTEYETGFVFHTHFNTSAQKSVPNRKMTSGKNLFWATILDWGEKKKNIQRNNWRDVNLTRKDLCCLVSTSSVISSIILHLDQWRESLDSITFQSSISLKGGGSHSGGRLILPSLHLLHNVTCSWLAGMVSKPLCLFAIYKASAVHKKQMFFSSKTHLHTVFSILWLPHLCEKRV